MPYLYIYVWREIAFGSREMRPINSMIENYLETSHRGREWWVKFISIHEPNTLLHSKRHAHNRSARQRKMSALWNAKLAYFSAVLFKVRFKGSSDPRPFSAEKKKVTTYNAWWSSTGRRDTLHSTQNTGTCTYTVYQYTMHGVCIYSTTEACVYIRTLAVQTCMQADSEVSHSDSKIAAKFLKSVGWKEAAVKLFWDYFTFLRVELFSDYFTLLMVGCITTISIVSFKNTYKYEIMNRYHM
jgi:hypothetical protein